MISSKSLVTYISNYDALDFVVIKSINVRCFHGRNRNTFPKYLKSQTAEEIHQNRKFNLYIYFILFKQGVKFTLCFRINVEEEEKQSLSSISHIDIFFRMPGFHLVLVRIKEIFNRHIYSHKERKMQRTCFLTADLLIKLI